jgi:hypothetical protein
MFFIFFFKQYFFIIRFLIFNIFILQIFCNFYISELFYLFFENSLLENYITKFNKIILINIDIININYIITDLFSYKLQLLLFIFNFLYYLPIFYYQNFLFYLNGLFFFEKKLNQYIYYFIIKIQYFIMLITYLQLNYKNIEFFQFTKKNLPINFLENNNFFENLTQELFIFCLIYLFIFFNYMLLLYFIFYNKKYIYFLRKIIYIYIFIFSFYIYNFSFFLYFIIYIFLVELNIFFGKDGIRTHEGINQ